MRTRKRSVTIKDVALASGCSWMTVSNVLNNRPGKVMEETRQRVLKAVRDLNYQPNAIARGLASRRMDTIGIVMPSVAASPLSPYFSLVLGGIVETAHEQRQNIMLFTGSVWMDSEQSLSSYRDGRCDGLLMLSPPAGSDIVGALVEVEVPFVVLGDRSSVPGVSSVYVDDVDGGRRAAEHLLDHGHRAIAVLSGEPDARYVQDRVLGYRQALEARGVAYDETLLVTSEHSIGDVEACIDALIRRPSGSRPTALFCTHDEMALLALSALNSRGISVPDEISVVGFDDVAAAATTHPKLTTIRQPLHEMGRCAVEFLLRQIRGAEGLVETREFSTDLVERESVARPK